MAASQQDPLKLLTERWQDSKRASRTRLRKIAFDDSVHKTYVKSVQPVVLREIRKKTVRHIVQPIIHEIDEEVDGGEDFVRPVTFREVHEDVPDHIQKKIIENQYLIANMIENHEESAGESEDEEHFENDHVQEVENEEIASDIQPIVKRKIHRRVRVNEVQPVQETVHRIENVEDVQMREAVSASEWQTSQAAKFADSERPFPK